MVFVQLHKNLPVFAWKVDSNHLTNVLKVSRRIFFIKAFGVSTLAGTSWGIFTGDFFIQFVLPRRLHTVVC